MKAPTPFWGSEVSLLGTAGIAVRRRRRATTLAVKIQLTHHVRKGKPPTKFRTFWRRINFEVRGSFGMETTESKKKILILGRPKSGKLSLVKALTSSLPPGLIHESTPHAGLTHSIKLTTRYFSTEAGIWIDEIPEDQDTWLTEYLSDEATVVFQSLAAIILTIGSNAHVMDLEVMQKLIQRGEELDWDATYLIVARESQDTRISDISSLSDESTFEYIDLNESGENEFGGIPMN
jgi:hypothetical protein